ncbi:MAG TPA: alpha/beta hydrolase [Pseudolysinimonas sp.]|nr:alpha/beta hydrolase [Pseudolysinimonas sp.]
MRTRRITALLAGAGVVTLLLSGCMSWFLPPQPSTTSVPTGEQVDADLAAFYGQVLVWRACGDGMQCTTATAPMNWEDPAQDSIELALVRQPATGQRKGSLLINPGGPGGSGYDFILDSVDYATSERLQQSYDIVGFDPRGVGRSSAVSCYDDPADFDEFTYGIAPGTTGSDEWLAALETSMEDFGRDCLEFTGPLLQYVDTISAARDLDLLRAVLGDVKLNYLGYSYGSYLGATYAGLYPEKTGHLVLDGALDPATSDFDVTKTQAVGFENALTAYLTDCVAGSDCPFRGVEQGLTRIQNMFASLEKSPLPAEDGRELGVTTFFYAVILPLYNQDNWPYLSQLFDEVARGGTSTAFLLADSYNERNPDGTYSSNSNEANIAINCLDYAGQADLEVMRREAAELAEAAPVFGTYMGYGGLTCEHWPFPSTRQREAIRAAGSADILVLGTTNDPATPYVWAQALADQLENGHLITYHGEGHTAYNKSNSCVDDAVDDYFIDDTVPQEDPDC